MEITSTEAQNNFGRYLKLAQFEDIIVTKNGKRVLTIKLYEEQGKSISAVSERAESYASQAEKISYEDYLKLTEASDNRYEYIDGEVYLLTSPSYEHQSIIMEVANRLYIYLKDKTCRPLTAPFDVTLNIDNNKHVVQPDIIVICDTDKINEKGRYTGVPTLTVEVLSESTQKKDMLRKLNLYLTAGVAEYWIINPMRKEVYLYCFAEQDIKEYRVYSGSQEMESTVFEGLILPLEQIFIA